MRDDSGTCLHKISCSECGSSDARQVYSYENKPDDSFCFACATYFKPDGVIATPAPTYKANNMESLDSIKSLPIRAIPERKITKETCEAYRVRVSVSQEDGDTITHIYSPDTLKGSLKGFECKETATKSFKSIGDRKGELDFAGQFLAKKNRGQKLFITEGRLDALSLYQTIINQTPDHQKQYKPSVVSLTRGCSGAVKDFLNNRDFLDSYKELILCFDMDSAGKEATKQVLKLYPMCKVAELPLKDCSDMLVADRGKELYELAVWKSCTQRLGEVVLVDDDLIAASLVRPKMGISTCWESLDKLTYGLHEHTIIVFGSYAKAGKSEWKNQLIHHLTQHHNRPVGVFDLEVHPIRTLKQIASKEARTNFLNPSNNSYSDEVLSDALGKFKGKLFIYDRTGSRDWEDIKACIIEQHLLDNVCEFFIDPLTALISREDSSSANDLLGIIMTDLADLVNTYPITVLCFSHVNPPSKGSKSHEEGGKILSGQFYGSRSMERFSHLGLGLERDRSADCPPEMVNRSTVKILYDRNFGASGSVDMFYDTETTEYLEPKRGYNY